METQFVSAPGGEQATARLGWILSDAAERLYRALLRGECPALVPTDSGAGELVDHGFATYPYGTKTRLLAIPPEIAVGRAVTTQTHRWLQLAPSLDDAAESIRLLRQIDTSASRPDPVLDNHDDRQLSAESTLASARREICVMQPYPYWMPGSSRDDAEQASTPDNDWTTRGVVCRYLYDERILSDDGFRKRALAEVAEGAQARVVSTLPTWMLIVDSARVLYLPEPTTGRGASTSASGLVASLQITFDSIWSTARPLHAPTIASDLAVDQRELIMLVASGKTNGAIARTLGVTERTIRRRMVTLYEHFGTQDRVSLLAAIIAVGMHAGVAQ